MSHCSLVLDLLPAYINGICQEDTCAFVENHLKECDACRREYEMLLVWEEEFLDTEERIFKEGVKKIEYKTKKRLLNREICFDFALNLLMASEFFFIIQRCVSEIGMTGSLTTMIENDIYFFSVAVIFILPFLIAEAFYLCMFIMKKEIDISETLARASMVAKCMSLLFCLAKDI